MKTSFFFLAILFSFFISACNTSPDKNMVYFNSFEKENDLSGWYGLDKNNLRNDAPVNGGSKSVLVGGGCVVPHASYTLQSNGTERTVYLKCYGKNLSNGGVIELKIGSVKCGCVIADTVWTEYTSNRSIVWPANEELKIEITAGGFVGSSVLVDNLEVVEAE